MLDATPTGPRILVEKISQKETRTEGGIFIPEHDEGFDQGVVLSLGTKVGGIEPSITLGCTVLYRPEHAEIVEIGSQRLVVPLGAVAAVVNPDVEEAVDSILELPDWGSFQGKDYKEWQPFENFKKVSFNINFLEPFRDVAHLGEPLYEHCVAELAAADPNILASLKYESQDRSVAGEGKVRVAVHCGDDIYDGAALVFDDSIQFTKTNTTLENLVESLPPWFRALSRLVRDPAVQPFLGRDSSRARNVSWTLSQRIRLIGKGTRKVQISNSDLMQQFLLLNDPPSGGRAPLGALGVTPDNVVRADLKLGFEREIDGRPYVVWANIQAPANELHSIIDIEWSIQDNSPRPISERQYGPVFEYLLREVIFRGFYQQWLREGLDVVCLTER